MKEKWNKLNMLFKTISAEQEEEIKKILHTIMLYKYSYPWNNLENDLIKQNQDSISLIGYGSLINRVSASLTITDTRHKKVFAFGIRRVFNYKIPSNIIRYGDIVDNRACAALNIKVTGKYNDVINAILVKVPVSDIPALRVREIAYDLIKVPCLYWDKIEKPPFMAYILHCPYNSFDGQVKTSSNIEPHLGYYNVCRDGAREFGKEFLSCWLDTTYLADGKTSVRIWEQKQLNQNIKNDKTIP